MFEKKKFLDLVDAYQSNKLVLQMVEKHMGSLVDYVAFVASMEIKIPSMRCRLEIRDFQEAVMDLDRSRRIHHEAAISSLSILNRMCSKAGIANLYEGDLDEKNPDMRYQVGNYCQEVVDVMFGGRTATERTIQDWIKAAQD